MTVTVFSNSPPGGRCKLYARYADPVARALDCISVDHIYPGKNPANSPTAPALAIDGLVIAPSDGVIVTPEDIVAVLAQAGLCDRLEDCRSELERIQDGFLTEMARTA